MFDMLTKNRFRMSPINTGRVLTAMLVFMAIIASAHPTQAQTTTFTYQGHLTDAGAPANGTHDFEFKLYDAVGAQVGVTLTRDDVQVTNGVFVVQLDFGVSPFASTTASTLEIGVRPGASIGAFTALAPRQPITSSPYAIKSLSAAELGGVAANQYVLTGDPRLSDARPPAPGNSNYIQNQTATSQAAGFNISGDGVIGGKVGIGTTSSAFALDVKGEDAIGNTAARIQSSINTAILSLDSTIGGTNQVWNLESGVHGIPGLFSIFDRTAFQSRLTIDTSGRVSIPGNLDVGQALSTNTLTGNFTIPASRITGALAVGNGGTGLGSAGAAGNFLRSDGTVWTSSPIQASDIPNLSGSFIQNTTTQQSASNFNVSGTGTAAMFDAATQYNISGQRVLSATGSGLGNTVLGLEAGTSISTGTDNAFVGFRAGLLNSQGSSNSFFGSESGAFNTTGSGNTFAGTASGKFNGAGSNNSFFGSTAGLANTASFNSFFGSGAGANNVDGDQNVFVGFRAGVFNTNGDLNTFVGTAAGNTNTFGASNSFFGAFAGQLNTAGNFNSFLGYAAGLNNSASFNNTFVGASAGLFNVTGNDNSLFGRSAGRANTSGSNNTILGSGADVGAGDLTNATAIGAGAIVSASNSLVLGNNANVGIGTSAPGSKLTVVGLVESTTGGVKFPDGTVQTTAAGASSITDIAAGGGLTGGGNTGNLTLDVGAGPGINVAADTISIADAGVTTAKLADAAVTAPKIAAGQVVKSLTVGASTLRDDLTLAAGSGITLTPAGNTVTIASTAGGGGGGNAILNQMTLQPNADFNISGSGTLGGTLSAGAGLISGNLGIGTTAPQTKLHVEGSGFVESTVKSTNERSILSLDSQVGGQRRIWTLESGVLGTPGLFGIYDRTASQARLVITQNGDVGIGTSSLLSKLTVNGGITATADVFARGLFALNVGVAFPGAAGSTHLCRNSQALIAFCSSSLRYKTDLQPFSDGLKFINQLRPISFKWKSDSALDVGFGAEDVARVNPLFVTYNDKGQVEGVKYDRLSVAFVNAFKEQQAQIERQQKQIDELKALVCSAYPAAEVCKQ